jgi:hypothetical protein
MNVRMRRPIAAAVLVAGVAIAGVALYLLQVVKLRNFVPEIIFVVAGIMMVLAIDSLLARKK